MCSRRIQFASFLAGALSLGAIHVALAWGPEGHALIADIAEAHLDAGPKAEVARLLKLENLSHLDEISSWADAVRSARPDTAPGHFVDIPLKAKSYSAKRDCHYDKDNSHVQELTCVVAMLPHWVDVLSDKTRPDSERLEALKWVVHFTGDIHQPLHNEDNNDRGGNNIHVTYYKKSTELHAVWDGGVIERHYSWTLGPNYSFDHDAVRTASQDLDSKITKHALTVWMSQGASANLEPEAAQWANWSHRLAQGAYKQLPASPRPHGWEDAYQAYAWPVINVQISAAGVRLAGILNAAFK